MAQETLERFDPAKEFPLITYGLPFPEACAHHLTQTLHRKRPFLVVSNSLNRNTDTVERLQVVLNNNNNDDDDDVQIAGIHIGMQPHTYYSDVLRILEEVRDAEADAIITVGGGSLIDGAKVVALVSLSFCFCFCFPFLLWSNHTLSFISVCLSLYLCLCVCMLYLCMLPLYLRVYICVLCMLCVLYDSSHISPGYKTAKHHLGQINNPYYIKALANNITSHDNLDLLLRTSNHLRRAGPPPAVEVGSEGSTTQITIHPPTLPILSITTTLSAGEFNAAGGATNDETKHKQLFFPPNGRGISVIILDPLLTTTTPERVWLSTGLRAVDHCVETIAGSNPNADGTESSLRGLRRLIPGLLRAKQNPGDLEARLQCQLGSADSMRASQIYGVHVGELYLRVIISTLPNIITP